jgi:hypothetical protein
VVFLAFSLFWNRSISSGSLFIWKSVRKSNGTHYERTLKVLAFFITWVSWCLFFFQFNPVPLNFNPNNKAIEKSAYKANTMLWKKIRRFLKIKVVNLLYIDQKQSKIDNPILRKELVALSNKEKRFETSEK